MHYQINHPDTPKWCRVNVSNLNCLFRKFTLREEMIRTSIMVLKANKKSKIIHLGGIRIKTESIQEANSLLEKLELLLRNSNNKKL